MMSSIVRSSSAIRRTYVWGVTLLLVAGCSAASTGRAANSEPQLTWSTVLADGSEVVIVSGGSTGFSNGVPQPIDLIDQAAERGCAAIEVERDFWAQMMADPDVGDRAAVYVAYANDRAAAKGC